MRRRSWRESIPKQRRRKSRVHCTSEKRARLRAEDQAKQSRAESRQSRSAFRKHERKGKKCPRRRNPAQRKQQRKPQAIEKVTCPPLTDFHESHTTRTTQPKEGVIRRNAIPPARQGQNGLLVCAKLETGRGDATRDLVCAGACGCFILATRNSLRTDRLQRRNHLLEFGEGLSESR